MNIDLLDEFSGNLTGRRRPHEAVCLPQIHQRTGITLMEQRRAGGLHQISSVMYVCVGMFGVTALNRCAGVESSCFASGFDSARRSGGLETKNARHRLDTRNFKASFTLCINSRLDLLAA